MSAPMTGCSSPEASTGTNPVVPETFRPGRGRPGVAPVAYCCLCSGKSNRARPSAALAMMGRVPPRTGPTDRARHIPSAHAPRRGSTMSALLMTLPRLPVPENTLCRGENDSVRRRVHPRPPTPARSTWLRRDCLQHVVAYQAPARTPPRANVAPPAQAENRWGTGCRPTALTLSLTAPSTSTVRTYGSRARGAGRSF